MKFFIFITILSLSYFDYSFANDYYDFSKIKGCFCEGGIILGKVDKKDNVKINGIQQVISNDGYFTFAFGRKFKKTLRIEINDESKVFIVKGRKYKIEKINGLPSNKVQPKKSELERIIKEQKFFVKMKKDNNMNRFFDSNFFLPFKGRISGVFGSQRILNDKPKRPHYGIDIAAKLGTNIKSPSRGKVKGIYENMFFTGNTLILDHGLGLISIFAHMEDIFVKEGDIVDHESIVGTVGKTGRATGPHLHWGVYLAKKPIDPMVLIDTSFN